VCSLSIAQTAPALRVGRIIVTPLDVYSDTEAKRGLFYSIADRLHIETRPAVIRRFLLFREGDLFRPERLAETERILRTLHFLKSASVTASEPHDGVVDITVTTQDAWSIAPETNAGNKGGETTYGISITDTNLLGLGKEVSVQWDKTIDRTRLGIDYQDPAINSTFWNAHLAYGTNSDGFDHRLTLRRPFYSFATPWSAELSFIGFRQNDRLFANGEESEKFAQSHRHIIASYGLALNPNDIRADRFTGGLRFTRDNFTSIRHLTGETLPVDRDYRYAFIRFDHADNDFIKLNFVNKDLRYEDFNLGRQLSMEGAVSPRFLGAEHNSAFARVAASDGRHIDATSFVMPFAAFESRFDGGVKNAIVTAAASYVRRYDTRHPATTAARVVFNNAWRLDAENQFFADGITGLRGYRLHSFAGNRSFVANFEHRVYLGHEIAQLVSPGVVAFIDTGNATYGSRLFALKTDVGVGLRIGLPRTPKNLLRLDLAYALNRDPRGKRGLLISFGSGQAF
jgi:hypothetical protein